MGSSEPKKRNRKRKASFRLPDREGIDTAKPPVPHLITGQHADDAKRAFAGQLRREMTPEETLLWSRLRGNRLHGLHFRRQQLIHGFIADFYCHAAGVVIEVDGGIHLAQAESDVARDLAFVELDLQVLRFSNEDVTSRMPNVLERIGSACTARIAEQNPE